MRAGLALVALFAALPAAAEVAATVLAVDGEVRVAGRGRLAAFATLAGEDRLEVDPGAVVTLMAGEREARLAGPVAGEVRELLRAAQHPERPAPATVSSAFAAAVRSLGDWFLSHPEEEMAAVRGASGEKAVPAVFPPSGRLCLEALEGPLAVRLEARLVRAAAPALVDRAGRVVASWPADATVLEVARRDLERGGRYLVLGPGRAGPRTLAAWEVADGAEGRLAADLAIADRACPGRAGRDCALLLASVLAAHGCHAQAEAVLEPFDGAAAGARLPLDLPWRHLVLEVALDFCRPGPSDAAPSLPGHGAWSPLAEGTRLEPGDLVRVRPLVNRPAHVAVLARNAQGGWEEAASATPADTARGLAADWLVLSVDGKASSESILVQASLASEGLDPGTGAGEAPAPAGAFGLGDGIRVAQGFGTARLAVEVAVAADERDPTSGR